MYDWAVGIDPYANVGLDDSEIPVDDSATDLQSVTHEAYKAEMGLDDDIFMSDVEQNITAPSGMPETGIS